VAASAAIAVGGGRWLVVFGLTTELAALGQMHNMAARRNRRSSTCRRLRPSSSCRRHRTPRRCVLFVALFSLTCVSSTVVSRRHSPTHRSERRASHVRVSSLGERDARALTGSPHLAQQHCARCREYSDAIVIVPLLLSPTQVIRQSTQWGEVFAQAFGVPWEQAVRCFARERRGARRHSPHQPRRTSTRSRFCPTTST
jgi:hypothetical protein